MSRRLLVTLLAASLARSLVLGLLIPPYQSSDEPWHLDYVRVLADGELPVLGETRLDRAIVAHDEAVTAAEGLTLYGIDHPPMSREAFQPPMAYAIPALAYRLVGRDPARGLVAFRIVDALLGVAAVALAVRLGATAFPGRRFAPLLAGLAAVALPAMALVASSANNDALATVISLWVLLVAVRTARDGADHRALLVLGGLVGAGAWTKATVAVLIVPAVVAVSIAPGVAGGARTRQDRAAAAALVVVTAVVLAAPWWIRDLVVYGDVGATSAFAAFSPAPGRDIGGLGLFVGERSTFPGAGRFWPRLARSTIGVLRWTDLYLPSAVYVAAVTASVGGLGAVVAWLLGGERRGVRAGDADRRVVAVVASAGAALLVALMWFSYSVDFQPQGRYLLPASIATAAVIGAAVRTRGMVIGGGTLVLLLVSTVAVAWQTFGWR